MKQFVLSLLLVVGFASLTTAQTVDELKSMKSDKLAALAELQGEVDAITKKIDEFPGWKIGGVGIAGFNLIGNNDWFALGNPNSSNSTLNLGFGGFANLDREKYFWRNLLSTNAVINTSKDDKSIDNEAPEDELNRKVTVTNALDLSSLFGYKLSEKWALSAEGKYTSSLIVAEQEGNRITGYNFALNQPGQLTLSAGATWTPISNLVVVIHPLGYQLNFPGEFISSPGAKIGATYAAELFRGISWTSNLSAFIPYSNGDGFIDHVDANDAFLAQVPYSTGDLVNWTWNNGFSVAILNGIGVTFNLALRNDKQVADLGRLTSGAATNAAGVTDSPLQSNYALGLSYTF